ncbi:hypothetical protein FACS1894140_0310 [Spirochaetia bacterium]|nr:hypothetical protein FACS1894140_0310 [Spirochaetia bacterium]
MVKKIIQLIFPLLGNVKKSHIAAGFAWGLLLGFVPLGNFFWIAFLVISLFFRYNYVTMVVVMFVIKLIMPLIAPLLDTIGWGILHIEALQPLFTTMYDMPLVPFTRFNNTLVAGALVSGIVLWLPVFYVVMALVPLYRNTIGPRIWNVIMKIPFMRAISKAGKGDSNDK